MSQEIGYVTLSHGMSLVITLTKDWSESPVQVPLVFFFFNPISPVNNRLLLCVLSQCLPLPCDALQAYFVNSNF
jgi:hypothetical protein